MKIKKAELSDEGVVNGKKMVQNSVILQKEAVG